MKTFTSKYNPSYPILTQTTTNDDLLWVIRAMGRERSREPLYGRFVVEDGYAVATDGTRLHKAKLDGNLLKDGLWGVVKVKARSATIYQMDSEAELSFPNWKHIMRDNDEANFLLSADLGGIYFEEGVLAGALSHVSKWPIYINPSFLEDLGERGVFRFYSAGQEWPLTGKDANGKNFVIMPLRGPEHSRIQPT